MGFGIGMPVARNFYWGGGGAYFKNRDQIINVGTLSHARAEALRREDRGHAPPEQF